jgi:hypothetical protein
MAGLFKSRNQRQSAWRDKILKQRCQHGCFDGLARAAMGLIPKENIKFLKMGNGREDVRLSVESGATHLVDIRPGRRG